MPPASRHPALAVFALSLLVLRASLCSAQPHDSGIPRVRPESPEIKALLQELAEQSPTGRGLIERLNASDVVVHLRFRRFPTIQTTSLFGRVGIIGAGEVRRLVVEIAPGRWRIDQLTTLAHELHHALEIADAPDIRDQRTLGAHYARVGIETSEWGSPAPTYETAGALAVGARVRAELLATLAAEDGSG